MTVGNTRHSGVGKDFNHKTLVNVMSKFCSGLKVVHFNARSLNNDKFDYVCHVFENSDIDIICITETWLNCDLNDSNFKINGYRLFRNDRKHGRGGGIAIYCKDDLNVQVVKCSLGGAVEFLCLELQCVRSKILLSCVYNPHRNNVLDSFFSEIAPCLVDYDNIIVCGDLNVNLLKSDNVTENFNNLLSANGMSAVNTNLPTRFSINAEPSLLDVFLVSNPEFCRHFGQCSFVSDHDLILAIFDVVMPRQHADDNIVFRDYKSVNYDALFTDFFITNWNSCWYMCDVDEKLEFIVNQLHRIYDTHIPLKSVPKNKNSTPWLTASVLDAIKLRNKLYSKWKRNPTEENWNCFKSARNNATASARNAKKTYFCSKLDTSLPSKQLWRNVRNLTFGNTNDSNSKFDPDELNDFFCSLSNSVNSEENTDFNLDKYSSNSFNFSPVSPNDVLRCINQINSNAIGEDGLSIKFIKLGLPYILNSLTHVINHIFTTSTFPRQWKIARIVPLAKKSVPIELGDFRPIAILSCLSKVCEMLMAEQIQLHLKDKKLLSPFQSGFRPGHSCSTALVKILDDIRVAFDQDFLTILCLLDFSKAFDSVQFKLLIGKLGELYGFHSSALKLMISYLYGRIQCVRSSNKVSAFKSVNSGVPQGSILGPILFTLFINDLFAVLKYTNCHAYADDVQIYLSNRVGLVEDLCVRINEDLENINKWAIKNRLSLNPLKSCVLPISRSNIDPTSLPPLCIGQSELKYVTKATNLGVILNTNLSCTDHANYVVSRIYHVLRNLRLSAEFTPEALKIQLVKQLIIPLIDYAALVYSKLDSASMHKIQVAFNYATRYVYNKRKFDHISNWSRQVLGRTVDQHLCARNCIFLHNLLITKSPEYLYEKICLPTSSRSLNLLYPPFKYLTSERLFFINATRLWNSLPPSIQSIGERGLFKKRVFEFFSSN